MVLLVGVVVYFRGPLQVVWNQMKNNYLPCRYPITYRINTFDTKFGVSKTDFLAAMKEAEAIWEKPIGKNLFDYKTDGYLKVNLVYDDRQKTTQELAKMGIVVKNDKESYDKIKSTYDSINASYKIQKAAFETRVAAFNVRKDAYEKQVAEANSKGGANKQTYARLNTEKQYLNGEMNTLNKLQTNLNTTISNLNTLASEINTLAKTLNINVEHYNTIGDDLGGEFDEGLYKSDMSGTEIDIYQFDNKTKLVRVLAHELGHALGLEHVDDQKAIMYRLNDGVNEKLTNADLVELKALCGIK